MNFYTYPKKEVIFMEIGRHLSIVNTIFLRLVDFVKEPFKLTQKEGGQTLLFTFSEDDLCEIDISFSPLSFYFQDHVIFSVFYDDTVIFETGSISIISENCITVLKKL